MTIVNQVKSTDLLTEQIAQLEFYKKELETILDNRVEHSAEYIAKTVLLIMKVDQHLKSSYEALEREAQ